jgi:hypothetical protein
MVQTAKLRTGRALGLGAALAALWFAAFPAVLEAAPQRLSSLLDLPRALHGAFPEAAPAEVSDAGGGLRTLLSLRTLLPPEATGFLPPRRPRPKSMLVAWGLSFLLIPGAGHVYVGDALSITVGAVHLAVQIACFVSYFLVDDPGTLLGIAIASLVNWVLNWADVLLFCHWANERLEAGGGKAQGPVKTTFHFDPAEGTVGLGWGLRF